MSRLLSHNSLIWFRALDRRFWRLSRDKALIVLGGTGSTQIRKALAHLLDLFYWQHPRRTIGVYLDSDGAIDYEGSKRSWEMLTYPIPTRLSDSNAPSNFQIRALCPP